MNEASLPELLTRLAEAQQSYIEADKAYSCASAQRTNCFNNLNSAQKALDEAYQKLRKSAPQGTDWRNGCTSRETV